MNFVSTKPDIRIMILQIIVATIVVFNIKTAVAMIILFIIINSLNLKWRDYRTFTKQLIAYISIYAMIFIFSKVDFIIFNMIIVPFLMVMFKIYPTYVLVKIFINHAAMNEMLYSLDKSYVSKSISIPIMVIYRYVPTIIEELKHINENLKMRGMGFSISNLKHLIRTIENYTVPLLVRSEKLTDELSCASLCKGLSTKRKRTCVNDVRFTTYDYLYLFGMLIVVVLVFHIDFIFR